MEILNILPKDYIILDYISKKDNVHIDEICNQLRKKLTELSQD